MEQVLMIAEWLSLPVKAGWAVFLAWTLLQTAWYRRVRVATPALRPLAPMPPERRRASAPPRVPTRMASARPYGGSAPRPYGEPNVIDGLTQS